MEEMSFVKRLKALPPSERIQYSYDNEQELENLSIEDLDRVGTLLCHASSEEMRSTYPIEGDLYESDQSLFEASVFGTLSEVRGQPRRYENGKPKELIEFASRGSNETL